MFVAYTGDVLGKIKKVCTKKLNFECSFFLLTNMASLSIINVVSKSVTFVVTNKDKVVTLKLHVTLGSIAFIKKVILNELTLKFAIV